MKLSQLHSLDDVESALSEPTPRLIDIFSKLDGDVMILGVAGKMGPTLARMARRAFDEMGDGAEKKRRVIGVARFSKPEEQQRLEAVSVETIRCDLLATDALSKLPDVRNIIYMAGMKFGSTGNESLTWAMNAFLPGMVCQRFPGSRIAAFSTGNVYGLTPVTHGGSIESDACNPIGDYAMSCMGRERMLDHFSRASQIPISILRLNYACEPRYGVLVDLARKVWSDTPIDLAMGNFNAIWQGDANAIALASLSLASSPATILNIAGPEMLSVRRTCEQFGRLMNKAVRFEGAESPDALLNNAQESQRHFGYPRITAGEMIDLTARWVMAGGALLGKPTHFETRGGKY